MIYKSTTDKLNIGGQLISTTNEVSGELDFDIFYKDLTDHNYTYNKTLVEKAFLSTNIAARLYGTQILEPGIQKPGSVVSWNSDTRSFLENSFKRESEAFYLDNTAQFQIAEPNTARVEYDIFSRKCKGILIEPLGMNRIPYSHGSINDSKSLKLGFEIVNSTTPFGTIIKKPSGTATTSTKHISLLLPDTIFTYYLILKIEDGRKPLPEHFKLIINGKEEVFNIEFISYGYYYITSTFAVSSIQSNQIEFQILEGLKDYNVYIYGEQLEEGLQRSSYIPTQGTLGIRYADEFTLNPTFNASNMSIKLIIEDSSKAAAQITSDDTTIQFYKDKFSVGVGDLNYVNNQAYFLYKARNIYIQGQDPTTIPFQKELAAPSFTFNIPTEGRYYISELVSYSSRVDQNTDFTKIVY